MSNKLCEGDSKKSISLKSRFFRVTPRAKYKNKKRSETIFYNSCTTNFSYKITGANIIIPDGCSG